MPKRLLFVDDDPMVLSGLRRSLHAMRGNWQMHFVNSGAAALEAMEAQHFDAVISDMRMPVMDGADLLNRIKQRYPDVVRMILSGQSSREALYRSISPAHQFLSKPCNPKELMARLGQAFAMRDLLSNQSLKTVVSGMRSIPSLPALYDELTEALRAESPSLSNIAKIISKDLGMAAKILQLANSAFMGTSGRVSSLVQALSLIGTETVRTLVLSVHVFSQFDGKSHLAASLTTIWEHSVAVSSMAQLIAASENSPKTLVEESFTAGLLHDVGKVVLLAEVPKEYREIFESRIPGRKNREQACLGCTHAEIGAYSMSIWGLPLPLVQAVAFHHWPSHAGETHFSSLTAVHAANAIVSASDPHPENHETELDQDYLLSLGLQEHVPTWCNLNPPPPPPQTGQEPPAKV